MEFRDYIILNIVKDRNLNIVILTISLLALLLAAGLWIRSDAYISQDANRAQWIAFALFICVFPIAATTLFGTNTKTSLLLVAVSVSFCLFIIEFGLFVINKIATTPAKWDTPKYRALEKTHAAQKLNVTWDSRSKIDVLFSLRKTDPNATLSIHPANFSSANGFTTPENGRIYPLAGLSNRTTILCNESGRWSIYPSDRYGFRNPRNVWDRPADVVIIGDSFAHGACLQEGEDASAHLRSAGRNSVSLGILGNGPLVELATLREYGATLKPKTVFWFYYEENDLENLKTEASSELLMRYLNDANYNQGLISKQIKIDKVLKKYVTGEITKYLETKSVLKGPPNFRFYVKQIFTTDILTIFKFSQLRQLLKLNFHLPIDPMMKKILEKANNIITAWNGKLVFVNLPGWTRYGTWNRSLYDSNIMSVARGLGIKVLDFDEVISIQKNPLSLFELQIHNHYNKKGYALLGKQLNKFLNSPEE